MFYKSKPHKIKAFHFSSTKVKAPDWLVEARNEGKVQVTLHDRYGMYITIYNQAGDSEKARLGDWVCMNSAGKLYAISGEEFEEAYEAIEEGEYREAA